MDGGINVAWLRHEYTNLVWTENCFVRAVIEILSECGFEHLPDDLQEDLCDVGATGKSSLCCELLINKLRAVARSQRSTKQGRVGRWHTMVTSDVPCVA